MKPFHLTGFFLEKCRMMWCCSPVCESSVLLQSPNIPKGFPEPRCLSVLSSGREHEGLCSKFLTAVIPHLSRGLGACAGPTENFWLRKENFSWGSLGIVRKMILSYSWFRKKKLINIYIHTQNIYNEYIEYILLYYVFYIFLYFLYISYIFI